MIHNAQIVAHHLRLFGFRNAGIVRTGTPLVIEGADGDAVDRLRRIALAGGAVVALVPTPAFLSEFGLEYAADEAAPVVARTVGADSKAWSRLRSLHPVSPLRPVTPSTSIVPIVALASGQSVWVWLAMGQGGLLIAGSDLGADLVRYRQGDPAAATNRCNSELWGFAFERPLYLFENQLLGEEPQERHADWWCWALREALVNHAGLKAEAVLPGNAPGAIVVTGDDDQAHLEMYDRQRAALDNLPVTYFLHPLTRHSRATLMALCQGRHVELGLHPDALDAPVNYAGLFKEQAAWFERLTGAPPRSVRNHGFLNEGYWGHLPSWIEAGIVCSSNLPGLDGRVVNGSLLPARLAMSDTLTNHWSVLTAIGDGVVFIQGRQGRAAGDVVRGLGRRVRDSGVPGVIVLNLHPQNIDKTEDMHAAARELVRDDFVAWTLSEMVAWFGARDRDIEYKDTSVSGIKRALYAEPAAILHRCRFAEWKARLRQVAHLLPSHGS